jgi:hypothetical protein
MYSYIYIDIHTYIHTHTHTYIHTYLHTHIHTYTHIHTCTYMHTHAHTYIHTYIHTYRQTDTHSIPYHIIPYHTIPYRIPYEHTYIPFHSIPYYTIPYHTYIHIWGRGGYLYLHLLADTQANVHTLLPPIHYHIPPPQGGRDRQRHTWFNIVVKLYVVPCSAFTLVFGPFDMRPAIMKGGFAMKMWTVCLVHKIVPQRLTVCGKP